MRQWKLSEQIFKNFTVTCRFSINAKIAHKISRCCDFMQPYLRNDYRSPEIHYQTEPLRLRMSSFHSYRKNQFKVFSRGYSLRTGNVPTQILGNVRCPILRIKTDSTPQCWCCLATDIWTKSRQNLKLKISIAANNADITRSVAGTYVAYRMVLLSMLPFNDLEGHF